MTTAMLNVRLDKNLKAAGERVLKRQDISATEAIKGLYKFIEENDEVPDFCKTTSNSITPDARKQKMRQLIGVVKLAPGEDYRTIKSERLSRLGFK